MIHELREYDLTLQCWPEYRRLFIEIARRVRADGYGSLLGAWVAEPQGSALAADHVRFLHLWEYQSLDARAELRRQLSQLPGWVNDFMPPAAPLIERQFLSALNPLHSGAAIASLAHRVSYLHRARSMVGKAGAVLAQAMSGAEAAWTTEFPDPNEIAWLTPADITPNAELRALIQSHRVHKLTPLNSANPRLLHENQESK